MRSAGTLLKGLSSNKSAIISFSSVIESRVVCCTETLWMSTVLSNYSTTCFMPFGALQTLLIELNVLFGPIL